MVLFIFVVMILNREEVRACRPARAGLRAASASRRVCTWCSSSRASCASAAPATLPVPPEGFGTVAAIGDLLFRDFLYPFEAISLLLLVAVVGGVVVSRSHKKEVAAEQAAERRKIVEQLAQHDFPALADHAADAHAGSGGHH